MLQYDPFGVREVVSNKPVNTTFKQVQKPEKTGKLSEDAEVLVLV